VSINNHLNEVFASFNSLNREFSSGFCLVDNFIDYFSFHLVNKKYANAKITYWNKLKNIYKDSSINQDTVLIISDMSVNNNITTSVRVQDGEL